MELAIEGNAVQLRNFTNPTKKIHRKIVTSTYDFAIDSIIDRVEQGAINLKQITGRPEFQRNYVLSEDKASKLVESILLSVPIPVCYFSEDKKYNLDVIDGQQRIYSLYKFVKGEFKLTGLTAFKEFKGFYYSDLPESIKRQFNAQTIRCIIIKKDSHPRIKFDVFERFNTNSTPLTAQEIRNCIYRGKFNDMLGKLANEETWLLIRNKQRPNNRLADEEIVLRFFSGIIYLSAKWREFIMYAGPNKINCKRISAIPIVLAGTIPLIIALILSLVLMYIIPIFFLHITR